MEENRTAQPRRDQPVRRRRRRRRGLGLLKALLYVVFVIGVSVLLAAVGWTLANDVLALNKAALSAEVVLPSSLFEVYEVDVEKKDADGNVTMQKKTVYESDLDAVSTMLEEKGLVEYDWLFKLFGTVTKSNLKLRPGTYTLDTNMDYLALVTNMGASSASRATVSVTFVEGSTVDQIFQLMEEKGVASVEDLRDMAATHNYAFSFLQEIPLGDHRRLEGYLFPDTYEFYLNENPKTAINKMLVAFDARVTDEMRQEIRDSGKTIHEIITLASMVEKETDGTDEKKIASVIYNRLNNPSFETAGLLQIDASLVYINGGRAPVEADKEIDSPYNTYKYPGLPAGPISNPGMAAINAAMNPDSTNYYYYALDPSTNRHVYSKNYNEHVNTVNGFKSNG